MSLRYFVYRIILGKLENTNTREAVALWYKVYTECELNFAAMLCDDIQRFFSDVQAEHDIHSLGL